MGDRIVHDNSPSAAELVVGTIVDGEFLKRAAGTIVSAAGGGAWTTIVKTADEVVVNNTLQDDDTLQFATVANTQYAIRLRAWFDTTATADFKYRMTHTGTTTRVRRYIERAVAGGTSATTPTVAMENAFDAADVTLIGTGTTGGFVREDIILQVGASGGVLKLQWAQNTTDAAGTTVLEGSYLERAVA